MSVWGTPVTRPDWYTDTVADATDVAHAAFANSDEYFNAYVDYTEQFEQSDAYDKAYEQWAAGDDNDEVPFDDFESWYDNATEDDELAAWVAEDGQ